MSLSKKNLDKLNKYKKNKNLDHDNKNISDYTNKNNKGNLTKNEFNAQDPNKIFYSLIDNSETLDDTSKVNHLLRNSESNQFNINSRNNIYSKKLTTEEELYDEFNFLLDE